MAAQFARALYTFEGSRIDNLPFKEGDIITVLKQDDGGWWQGSSLDGRIGCAFARARGSRETNEARPWHARTHAQHFPQKLRGAEHGARLVRGGRCRV